MAASVERMQVRVGQEDIAVRVPLVVLGLSSLYASVLAWLERRYPIKPDHTWAEVAGGVLLTLVPLALEARARRRMSWQLYENTIWRCFIASGTPIILWQIGEAVMRHVEILQYTIGQERRRYTRNAHNPTPLALGGRAPTGGGTGSGERSSDTAPESPGDA